MEIDAYIPVTKAKTALLDMIRALSDQDDTIAITRNGTPAAVMMSMAQYEALRETLAILGDEEIMRRIRQSRRQVKAGRPLVDLADL
jgi:antitoxin YefM